MDFYDATELMRLVQAVENDPIVSSGAGESLASKVREFIEDEAEMGGWYTELMDAIGEAEHEEPTFKECGTFTDHGFGFHAQEGTRTDYIIGYPYENDGWAVLTGSYDLENDDLDCHVPEDYLNGLISYYGYSSLDDLKYVNGDAWRNVLTGIIAERQEAVSYTHLDVYKRQGNGMVRDNIGAITDTPLDQWIATYGNYHEVRWGFGPH